MKEHLFKRWAWVIIVSEQSMNCHLFTKSVNFGDNLRQNRRRRDREADSDHPSLTPSVLIRILLEIVGLTVTAQIGLHQLSQELCRCSTGFKRANRRDNLSPSHGKVYWLEVDLLVLGENTTVFLMQNSKTISQKQIVFQISI